MRATKTTTAIAATMLLLHTFAKHHKRLNKIIFYGIKILGMSVLSHYISDQRTVVQSFCVFISLRTKRAATTIAPEKITTSYQE